jgi:hypothetical protein
VFGEDETDVAVAETHARQGPLSPPPVTHPLYLNRPLLLDLCGQP